MSSQELVPFSFEGQKVRTIAIDGEPWWIAKDVCDVLDIDTSNLSKTLDDDEKGTYSVRTNRGDRRVTVINEPGLYSLVLKSRKPQAKPFKRWITHEVIPQIRRTGKYQVPGHVDTPARQMTEIEVVRKHLEALEYIERLKPRAELLDLFEDVREGMSIADVGALFGYKPHPFHEMCRVMGATYHNPNGQTRASKFWLDKGWLKSRRRGRHGAPAVTPEGLAEFERRLNRQVGNRAIEA